MIPFLPVFIEIPVDADVHEEERYERYESVYKEVEVDDVDLTIVNILPEVCRCHTVVSDILCAVVKDRLVRGTRQDTCLQLKESWNVVKYWK